MARELADGLVLRWATEADTEAVAAFLAMPDDPRFDLWLAHLLDGRRPGLRITDFTLVAEAATGRIVSCAALVDRTWSYGGVPVAVGELQLVETHRDFRRRGLMAAQFAELHDAGALRGHRLQVVDGIPCFYRQLGYEPAVEMSAGRSGRLDNGPSCPGEEPFRLVPATLRDLPRLTRRVREGSRRYAVSLVRDEAQWRYELIGRREPSWGCLVILRIEAADGRCVGYLVRERGFLGRDALFVWAVELEPGLSWAMVSPSLLRAVRAMAEEVGRAAGTPYGRCVFALGSAHPLFTVARQSLPHAERPYAWHVRLPDVPAFVAHVAPALERRLAASPCAGHTGELRLSFYRGGLRLRFEAGALAEVAAWDPVERRADALLPGLTFPQLLFGHRSLEQLQAEWCDCEVEDDVAAALLEALFPRLPSCCWSALWQPGPERR